MQPETMSGFFAARAEGYDSHMLNNVEGCKEGYIELAELLPLGLCELLDLGCGTGLELDAIFQKYPSVSVTGIDLTKEMLDKLKQKYPDKHLTLINTDYFSYDFSASVYDAAISFETLHHFSHEQKRALYKSICVSLKPSGVYIECDYMVLEQSEEDRFFEEAARVRRELGAADGTFLHIDTPCTVTNQLALLKSAGFKTADMVWRMGATTMIVARK